MNDALGVEAGDVFQVRYSGEVACYFYLIVSVVAMDPTKSERHAVCFVIERFPDGSWDDTDYKLNLIKLTPHGRFFNPKSGVKKMTLEEFDLLEMLES